MFRFQLTEHNFVELVEAWNLHDDVFDFAYNEATSRVVNFQGFQFMTLYICSECEMQIANRSAKYMPRRMRGSRNLPSSANKNTALHGGIKINSQAVGYHA